MAIDYIINHGCAAREDLGSTGIIDLVKSKTRGQMLLDRFMKDGMSREDALQTAFGMQVKRVNGDDDIKRVTVGQLLREAELLLDYDHLCKECPASFQKSFGCFSSINYPLTERSEEWLAKLAAKAAMAGLPNSILLQFILDQGVTGEVFSNMRDQEGFQFLEARYPIEVEIENDGIGSAVIDTNQLLEMMFAVGEMEEVHMQFVLFFSGGLSIQDHPPAAERLGIECQAASMEDKSGNTRFWVYRMADELSDDYSIKQIKAFLRALFAAYVLKATVTIDC